jgi:hypothetical protein
MTSSLKPGAGAMHFATQANETLFIFGSFVTAISIAVVIAVTWIKVVRIHTGAKTDKT